MTFLPLGGGGGGGGGGAFIRVSPYVWQGLSSLTTDQEVAVEQG